VVCPIQSDATELILMMNRCDLTSHGLPNIYVEGLEKNGKERGNCGGSGRVYSTLLAHHRHKLINIINVVGLGR
jgi:hypothetical protein